MINARLRGSLSSLSVARAKLDGPKAVSDGYSDVCRFETGMPHELPKSCDICRRSESLLNPILVCSSCKVSTMFNCNFTFLSSVVLSCDTLLCLCAIRLQFI